VEIGIQIEINRNANGDRNRLGCEHGDGGIDDDRQR
jgi:hypothetical protein